MKKILKAIPTNIVTGFLGVGKTSAILHLLKNKPANETWAVLVNEYGSLGIDADILINKGAFVEQVPGGCICCAQGLPFEVAINRLIKTAKPDRLIIEPSGLAHPDKIISQLSQGYFKTLISLKATICLVDIRHFMDSRYSTNEMFIDQISLADILLGNKSDLGSKNDLQQFNTWANHFSPKKSIALTICYGEFNLKYLQYERNPLRKPEYPNSHSSKKPLTALESWREVYSADILFDRDKLIQYFQSHRFIRLKAIIHTNKGWIVFNQVEKELNYYKVNRSEYIEPQDRLNSQIESRIEILGRKTALPLNEFKIG